MGNLSRATLLEKTDFAFLSSYQLPVAPQIGVGLHSQPPSSWLYLVWLRIAKSVCMLSYHHRDFIWAPVLMCLEDIIDTTTANDDHILLWWSLLYLQVFLVGQDHTPSCNVSGSIDEEGVERLKKSKFEENSVFLWWQDYWTQGL